MPTATRTRVRTGGYETRAVMAEGNGVEYRFRRLEDSVHDIAQRVDNIDVNGSRRVGVLEAEVKHIRETAEELARDVKGLRNTVIGATVTLMIAGFGIAATVLLGGGP